MNNGAPTVDPSWFKENAEGFSGQLLFEEPLSRYTYYRIGGPASVVAIPKSQDDLRWLARGIAQTGIPFFILGAGSNLLVADEGYRGLVIRGNRLNQELGLGDGGILRAGSSVMISSLLRQAANEGWGGLEFLAGVPGTVGGAIFMNAGTHLGETKDRLYSVEIFDLLASSGDLRRFRQEELSFEYRKNTFLPQGALVWAAEWKIPLESPAQVKAIIDGTLARRKASQPIDFPSCGSVFKNPRESGRSAWQVVDQLGLRGHRIGNAQFAQLHSNFIINLGGAKASEVLGLIQLAKERAQKELGIQLQEEVIYLG